MRDVQTDEYWSRPSIDLIQALDSSTHGLSSTEAKRRQVEFGLNALAKERRFTRLALLLGQFKSPIILILLGATLISALTGDYIDAGIILTIILASAVLSYFQELHASKAVEELRDKVKVHVLVWRDGNLIDVPAIELVPRRRRRTVGRELGAG
ncbi:cation-transporting P-type ATPase [Exiguobacterium sp. SH0S7]|uniref:cation-transporting P-type ATPase n=1 Tax=Exiguobacterium sp. SH0S7 TaxID=2510951 RepID=UPI0018F47B08|nr:cation-transporting P-type ATPase [Exiguobacterium sp. SH0S7]